MPGPRWKPLAIAVAPNGATRSKKDHPRLPMTRHELVDAAVACRDAGAVMFHLHVRDHDGLHLLDEHAYRSAINAIAQAVGSAMVIQITTESAGRYRREQQMAVLRAVVPEAASLALREFVPDASAEREAADLFSWLRARRIMTQMILYSSDELLRFEDLKRRGVFGPGPESLMFVLGRYKERQESDPRDLLAFVSAHRGSAVWSSCAFGSAENACAMVTAALGGHVRVGFENNLWLPDGTLAPDNSTLVRMAVEGARLIGRPLASADDWRTLHL